MASQEKKIAEKNVSVNMLKLGQNDQYFAEIIFLSSSLKVFHLIHVFRVPVWIRHYLLPCSMLFKTCDFSCSLGGTCCAIMISTDLQNHVFKIPWSNSSLYIVCKFMLCLSVVLINLEFVNKSVVYTTHCTLFFLFMTVLFTSLSHAFAELSKLFFCVVVERNNFTINGGAYMSSI